MAPKELRPTKRQDGGKSSAPKTSSLSASMAAMVCSSTQKGGGGARQLASIFAQFNTPSESTVLSPEIKKSSPSPTKSLFSGTPAIATLNAQRAVEPNEAVVAILKKITKRSDATRIKGLEDFTTYLKGLHLRYVNRVETLKNVSPSSSSESIEIESEILAWLPEFCRVYRAGVLTDSEKRIRCGLNRCLELVLVIIKRQIAPFLRSIFPVWWISCQDRHREVSNAAKEALAALFPEDQPKRRLDLAEYSRDCIIDESYRLLSYNEDSLHLDLFGDNYKSIPQGIREERFDRIIAATLIALSQLISLLGTKPEKLGDWAEDLRPLFASQSVNTVLYGFLSISRYRPAVRCAAAKCLSLIFSTYHLSQERRLPDSTIIVRLPLDSTEKEAVKKFSLSCLGIFGDNDSDVQAVAPRLFISFLHLFPERFSSSKPEQTVYPHLLASIRHNSYSTGVGDISLWRELPAIISAIPSNDLIATPSGREFMGMLFPYVLLSLSKVDKSVSSLISKPCSTDLFLCFFQIIIFIFDKRLLCTATCSPDCLSSSTVSVPDTGVSPSSSSSALVSPVFSSASSASSTLSTSNLHSFCLGLVDEIIDKWLWCPVELYLSLLISSNGRAYLDFTSRVPIVTKKKVPREKLVLDLDASELSSIPSITAWTSIECLNRQFPISIFLRLQFLLLEAIPSVFSFTATPQLVSSQHVQHAEQFIELVTTLDQTLMEGIKNKTNTSNPNVILCSDAIFEALSGVMRCLTNLLEDFGTSKNNDRESLERIESISKLLKVMLMSLPLRDIKATAVIEMKPSPKPLSELIPPQWVIDAVISLLRIPLLSFTSQCLILRSTNRESNLPKLKSWLAVLKMIVVHLIAPIHSRLPKDISVNTETTQQMLEIMIIQIVLDPSATASSTECRVVKLYDYLESQVNLKQRPLDLSLLLVVYLLQEFNNPSNFNQNLIDLLPLALRHSLQSNVIELLENPDQDCLGCEVLPLLQRDLYEVVKRAMGIIKQSQYANDLESLHHKEIGDTNNFQYVWKIVDDLFNDGCPRVTAMLKSLKPEQQSTINKCKGNTLLVETSLNDFVEFICSLVSELFPMIFIDSGTNKLHDQLIGINHLSNIIEFCFEALWKYLQVFRHFVHSETSQMDEGEKSWKSAIISTLKISFSLLRKCDVECASCILRFQIFRLFDSLLNKNDDWSDSISKTRNLLGASSNFADSIPLAVTSEYQNIYEWVDSGLLLMELMPSGLTPSLLGIRRGFWLLVTEYVGTRKLLLTKLMLNCSIKNQIILSCHLLALFIASDTPVKTDELSKLSPEMLSVEEVVTEQLPKRLSQENVGCEDGSLGEGVLNEATSTSPVDISEEETAADVILAIWLGELLSQEYPSSNINKYLKEGLKEVVIARIWMKYRSANSEQSTTRHLGFDSIVLLRKAVQLICDAASQGNNIPILQTLLTEILDIILLEICSDPTQRHGSCYSQMSYLFGKVSVGFLVSVTKYQLGEFLLAIWNLHRPNSQIMLTTFVKFLNRRRGWLGIEGTEKELVELRNAVFLSVYDAINALEKAVTNAEPGQYPREEAEELGRDIVLLADLMLLINGDETSELDVETMFEMSQKMFSLVESCGLLVSCVIEKERETIDRVVVEPSFSSSSIVLNHLMFVECLCHWTLYIKSRNPNHGSIHPLDCTALLTLKEGFLMQYTTEYSVCESDSKYGTGQQATRKSHEIRDGQFLLLSKSLELLSLLLEVPYKEGLSAELTEQLEPVICEAALIHLARFDSALCNTSEIVNFQQRKIILQFFMSLGSLLVRMATQNDGRVVPSLENRDPPANSPATELACLLTRCAVEWKCPFLQAPCFEALYHMKGFPWFRVPFFQLADNNPLRGESINTKIIKPPKRCEANSASLQLLSVLEDSCKMPESQKPKGSGKYIENTYSASCGVRSLLILFLGEYFGSRIAGVGTFMDLLLSEITGHHCADASDREKNHNSSDSPEHVTRPTVHELRLLLNIWLVLLTSLKYERHAEFKKASLSTEKDIDERPRDSEPDPWAILELRTEIIKYPDELYCRILRIAQTIPPTLGQLSTQYPAADDLKSMTRYLQMTDSKEYKERSMLHALIELVILVVLLGHDTTEESLLGVLSDAKEDTMSSFYLSDAFQRLDKSHLRINPGVKSQLALLKRGIYEQDWLVSAVEKIGTALPCTESYSPQKNEQQQAEDNAIIWDTETDWILRLTKDANINLDSIPVLSESAFTSSASLWVLSARILLLVSELFPVALRQCLSAEHSSWLTSKILMQLEQIFRSVISPRLLSSEIEAVKLALLDSEDQLDAADDEGKKGVMNIQYDRHLRQLRFRISAEELSVEAGLDFHDAHPLRCPNFKCFSTIGIPKAKIERWIFSAKQVLLGGRDTASSATVLSKSSNNVLTDTIDDAWDSFSLTAERYNADLNDISTTTQFLSRSSTSGTMIAALTLFKANVNAFFSGVEDCSICYAVVHGRSRAIPKIKCTTCKYKFHAECLDRWFKTSHKNICPLCQTEFL